MNLSVAQLSLFADAAPSDPLTIGVVFAAVTVPVLGLFLWFVRHIVAVSIPEIQKQHREDLTALQKTFSTELKESRDLFRDELKTLRDTYRAEHLQIVAELHRLGDLMSDHEARLSQLLSSLPTTRPLRRNQPPAEPTTDHNS